MAPKTGYPQNFLKSKKVLLTAQSHSCLAVTRPQVESQLKQTKKKQNIAQQNKTPLI